MNNVMLTASLDVGCGEDYTGTVNVDLYPTRTFQSRYRGRPGYVRNLKRIPNFIQASINHLPFKSKSFKTVICNHLLEHKGVNLVRACRELLRVASGKVVMTVPSSTCASRLGTNHDKILTTEAFHILFRKYKHKVKYTRFTLRDTMMPFRFLRRLTRWRTRKGFPVPFYYLPSVVPTQLTVTVNKQPHHVLSS